MRRTLSLPLPISRNHFLHYSRALTPFLSRLVVPWRRRAQRGGAARSILCRPSPRQVLLLPLRANFRRATTPLHGAAARLTRAGNLAQHASGCCWRLQTSAYKQTLVLCCIFSSLSPLDVCVISGYSIRLAHALARRGYRAFREGGTLRVNALTRSAVRRWLVTRRTRMPAVCCVV